MSPEQFAGESGMLGPASDVYSLGATLYMLLTGRPAYHDIKPPLLAEKIKLGDFPSPRRINRDVPALSWTCLKAMALRPEDRYASARAWRATSSAGLAVNRSPPCVNHWPRGSGGAGWPVIARWPRPPPSRA